MKAAAKRATTKEKKNQTPLRLDATMKAKIRLYAKTEGQSFNEFVTAAAKKHVDEVMAKSRISWRRYADHPAVSGYLECLMFTDDSAGFAWNDEEAQTKLFVHAHKAFFFLRSGKPNAIYLQQLWPKLAHYMSLWGYGKPARTAAEAMAKDLESLGHPAPAWTPDPNHEDDDPGIRQDH